MYSIAICSPSKQEADILQSLIHRILNKINITHIICYYENPFALSKILKKYPEKYNLLFLDTAVHSGNGILLAKKIRQEGYKASLVLLSDTADYVFDGYDVDACQYFLKPVPSEKLQQLFFRLSIKKLQHSSQCLLLNTGSTYYRIPYSDILYIETAGRKVALHTKTTVIYYPCKLSTIEELLPSHLFIRCHQSFLLQLSAVQQISKSSALLTDGTEISISRSYKENVQNIFRYL